MVMIRTAARQVVDRCYTGDNLRVGGTTLHRTNVAQLALNEIQHCDMSSRRMPEDLAHELYLSRLGVLPKGYFDGVKDVVSLLGKSPATTTEEITEKRARFSHWMKENGADYFVLRDLNAQNWLLGGRDFHEITNTSVATFLVPRDPEERIRVFINNIEQPRITQQEMLQGIGPDWQQHVELVINKWNEQPDIASFTKGRAVADDLMFPGFHALHYSMLPVDIERYEWLAQVASAALTKAAYFVSFGKDSEADVAAHITRMLMEVGVVPDVLLVAADAQIRNTNHPLPRTEEDGGLIKKDVAMVLCARHRGYIVNLTRRACDEDTRNTLEQSFDGLGKVAARAFALTKPGSTYGNVYLGMRRMFESFGWSGDHELCHWGGPTGIGIRDLCVSDIKDPTVILPHQAFTWNPIHGGVKIEETILSAERDFAPPRVLTGDPYSIWPMRTFSFGDRPDEQVQFADILVR